MKITAEMRQLYRAWNFGVIAAREEYAAHPLVAVEEDWCEACDWPREKKRCHVCRAAVASREAKRRRSA